MISINDYDKVIISAYSCNGCDLYRKKHGCIVADNNDFYCAPEKGEAMKNYVFKRKEKNVVLGKHKK